MILSHVNRLRHENKQKNTETNAKKISVSDFESSGVKCNIMNVRGGEYSFGK